MAYTIDQFGELIKSKYPDYKDINNNDLVNKILEKYPDYKEQVDMWQTKPIEEPTTPVTQIDKISTFWTPENIKMWLNIYWWPLSILWKAAGLWEFWPWAFAKAPEVVGNIAWFLAWLVDDETWKKIKEAWVNASELLKQWLKVEKWPLTTLWEMTTESLPVTALSAWAWSIPVVAQAISKAPIISWAIQWALWTQAWSISSRWKPATIKETAIWAWVWATLWAISKWIGKLIVKTPEQAQKEAFKALNPTTNKLIKNRWWLTWLENKANRANELIIDNWFIPTDTETRMQSHLDTMKNVWWKLDSKLKWVWKDVNIDFSKVWQSIDDYISNNPALKEVWSDDYNKLKNLADTYKSLWNKDVLYAENAKQIINSQIKNWWEWPKVSEAVQNWLKEATRNIWEQLDDKLSSIPWEFSNLKKDYWALAETLPDIIKSNIVNQRAKWLWLTETFSRIEWAWDIVWALWWLFSWQNPIPWLAKWWAKIIIWKQLQNLRDPDVLIQKAFDFLSKAKTPIEKTPWVLSKIIPTATSRVPKKEKK